MRHARRFALPVCIRTTVAIAALAAGLSACNQSSDNSGGQGADAAALARLTPVATDEIAKNPELNTIAMTAGKALYGTNCASCHGPDLKGLRDHGTPDLTDNEWLYIGDDPDTGGIVHHPSDVEKTVLLGIRAVPRVTDQGSQQANDAKNLPNKNLADMPAMLSPEYGLTEAEIADVTEYVLQLGGQDHNAEMAARGKTTIYDEKGSCYDCHDPEGIGDQSIGSTNLTKPALYLYGSTREAILASLKMGRKGIMPALQGKLKSEEVKAIAVYVFSNGGPGEITPAP